MTALVFSGEYDAPVGTATLAFGSAANDDGPYEAPIGTANLVFDEEATSTPGIALLNFGSGGGPSSNDRPASITATATPPHAFIQLSSVVETTVYGILGAPTATVAAANDINVQRFLDTTARGTSAQSEKVRISQGNPHENAARLFTKAAARHEQAAKLDNQQTQPFEQAARVFVKPRGSYEEATPVNGLGGFTSYETGGRIASSRRANYEQATPINSGTFVSDNNGLEVRSESTRAKWNAADALAFSLGPFAAGSGLYIENSWRVVYEDAINPPSGDRNAPEPPEPPEPPGPDPQYDADLTFCALPINVILDPLRFGFDYCDITPFIPALRIYTVTNSASIIRVSDGLNINASRVSLSTNTDSFTWDMTATIIGSDARTLIETGDFAPVEVDVEINGDTWRILLDGYSLAETANGVAGQVRGRSQSALLAAPYENVRDYTETSQRLAQQLAAQELPIGWSLDWNIDDWLVPANVWKYEQRTPIQAISDIAKSGGGYIRTHKQNKQIIVEPAYPTAPWQWSTASVDLQIPRDYIDLVARQKVPGSGTNSVYVHGKDASGVYANVRVTGTAGDVRAPTIVNRLVTSAAPARALGIEAIARLQPQSIERVSMPIGSAYGGLLDIGAFVAFGSGAGPGFTEEWRGLVRSLQVNAEAGRTTLEVRQLAEIERHY